MKKSLNDLRSFLASTIETNFIALGLMKRFSLVLFFAGLLSACGTKTTLSGLDPADFLAEKDGKSCALYTLKNKNGMEVCITNFGGRIVSVVVPDRTGTGRDVVLGFDNIRDYISVPSDFGAVIGRYANRIDRGRIVLDGDTIQLPRNNYGHCLHGGPDGWQYKVFDVRTSEDSLLILDLVSPDGDASFPGQVTAAVTYRLTEDNALDIAYRAVTDRKTVINLTNHSYFNLSGNPALPITDHLLQLDADAYTPVDSTFMTTGEIQTVHGTPMDFTSEKPIGRDIDRFDFPQLKNGKGYDHNWVLNQTDPMKRACARLSSPRTGIVLEVFTDEPGLQVYTGNFLDGTVTGKRGIAYPHRAAVCLETQHYPDSPNKPQWPSVVLEPGQTYQSRCIYKFSVTP